MVKYQIKEALDKIAYATQFTPNESVLTRAKPNDIRLVCTTKQGTKHEFRYADGVLTELRLTVI